MHALKLHRPRDVSTAPAAAVALVACLSLGACVGATRAPDVAVYASGTDLESGNPLVTIHPLSRQIQRYALFVTLARYDSSLAPAPYAARSWEWSADRRTLTLHLVTGLAWQDGVPTTARDAAFTLLAARDPSTGYARATDLAAIDTAVATNDSTVVIRFSGPQPAFPLVLCELPIVPAHRLARIARADFKRAAFNLQPVGNGPFKFVDRRPGERWTFARNDGFPRELGGPPRLAGLVVAVVDEPTTKFAGLASGDLDVAGIAPTMAHLAARDPSLRVVDYPVLFTTGLVFNSHRPPFDDARVRRAVDLSLDRARIVRAALAGYGTPATGPVPPESPFALPSTARPDTLLADSLLDAADWRRASDGTRVRAGARFAVDLLTVGSGDNAVEQLVQADLAARGIRLEIRQMEMGAFLNTARAADKRFDVILTGVSGDVSLAYLGALFESRQKGGTLDYAGFHTTVLDSLFRAARGARSTAEEQRAWWDVQRALARDVPIAWLYHARGLQGLNARLQHVVMDLRGELVTISQWSLARPGRTVAAR